MLSHSAAIYVGTQENIETCKSLVLYVYGNTLLPYLLISLIYHLPLFIYTSRDKYNNSNRLVTTDSMI